MVKFDRMLTTTKTDSLGDVEAKYMINFVLVHKKYCQFRDLQVEFENGENEIEREMVTGLRVAPFSVQKKLRFSIGPAAPPPA